MHFGAKDFGGRVGDGAGHGTAQVSGDAITTISTHVVVVNRTVVMFVVNHK